MFNCFTVVTFWLVVILNVKFSVQSVYKRAVSGKLCNEPEVGYHGTVHGLYYTFYESRKHPASDPVILWLTGGPGCSGMLAMLFENGPCSVVKNGKAVVNKYSWTEAANVIFIDQPQGTGFSSPNEKAIGLRWKEDDAIELLSRFISTWFQEVFPEFDDNKFYIFGESYGGHYAPQLAHYIVKSGEPKMIKRLKGVGIGNGLISPKALYSSLPDMIFSNPYVKLIDQYTRDSLVEQAKDCVDSIEECQKHDCFHVYQCNRILGKVIHTLKVNSLNLYDIRKKCISDPSNLCYSFETVTTFLNSRKVKSALGTMGKKWTVCSSEVSDYARNQDFYSETEKMIPLLLEKDVRILIYAGDADTVCNWLGQDKWTKSLRWSGRNSFNAAAYNDWKVDGMIKGKFRSSSGLTFIKIHQSGHMVPHDQPVAALSMVKRFISQD